MAVFWTRRKLRCKERGEENEKDRVGKVGEVGGRNDVLTHVLSRIADSFTEEGVGRSFLLRVCCSRCPGKQPRRPHTLIRMRGVLRIWMELGWEVV